MVSFSVYRNWYVLSSPTRKENRDLRAISAIRIWTMISIIYGHATWFSVAVPLRNPIFIEKVRRLLSSQNNRICFPQVFRELLIQIKSKVNLVFQFASSESLK